MKNHKHKEEMPSLPISYLNDVKRVSSKIITDSFSESQFQKLNSPIILRDIIAENAKKVFDIGNQQYHEFVKTRFGSWKGRCYKLASITKNNLKTFS